MPDLHIFKAQIGMCEPVALFNHNVVIHFNESKYYKRVNFLEPIPEFNCINLGAIPATNQTGRTNVTNLEMADNEFGVFRMYPIDYFQLQVYHPGVSKSQLRNLQVVIGPDILINDPNLVSTELAVWEWNRPVFIGANGLNYPTGAARVKALGYRFHTAKIVPVTKIEKDLVAQMRQDPAFAGKDPGELMIMAIDESRLPATHIWASGRATGD